MLASIAWTLAKDTRQAHLSSDGFIFPRSAHILATQLAGGGASMRLTSFFDYTLRLLMYAATHSDRLITIEETAGVYGISRTHLMKVANQLTRAGYLKAVRGRSGGLTLAKRPNRIKIGDVLCATEPDFALVECFSANNRCPISSRCRLRAPLKEALAAFTATLDRYTLADLILNPKDFGIPPAA
jgi:Rrf2 family transcriptional regulator, nitric oxide-sensitive transcriptional repressor